MSNFSLTALLPGWLEIIFFIYWTFTIVLLVMDDREPSITLAWLFILIFVPLIGVFFYIFFGRDWKVVAQRKGWVQTLKRVETEEMAPIYERNAGAAERFAREWAGTIAIPVSRAITSENVSAVLPAASVELSITGRAKFARLKEDLAGAQRFIHLQYFIWEQDRLTAEIVPILLERLAAGLEAVEEDRHDLGRQPVLLPDEVLQVDEALRAREVLLEAPELVGAVVEELDRRRRQHPGDVLGGDGA